MPIKLLWQYKSRYAPKGSFAANVLTLMTGTAIAQAIPIAILPILTRLYTPDDFGVFALFSSIVSLVAILATGRYELAIMLPEDDEDAINLLALSIVISLVVSCIGMVAILLFDAQLAALIGNQGISIWLYWIPLTVLLTGLYQALNCWISRKKLYERLSISRISQSTSTALANITLGFSGLNVGGMILASIFGQSSALSFMGLQVWRDDKYNFKLVSFGVMWCNAKKYRNFPLVNVFHAFLDAMQTSGVVFAISIYYGSAILGFYYFVLRVLRAPLNLIGSSVSQVFYQQGSETYNQKGDLHHLLRITMLRLGLIALPMFIGVILFAPNLFSLVFGSNWIRAGEYAQILSPWIFLNFIVSPISGIYLIVGKQKQALIFGIIDAFLKFTSIALGVYCNDAVLGFYFMSFVGAIISIAEIIWALKLAKL